MRIKSVKRIKLEDPVPVADLTVEGTENFQLASGPFVHNSKDCSDAIAGVTYILQRKEAQYGHGGGRRKRTPTAQRAKDAGGRHVRVGRRRRG